LVLTEEQSTEALILIFDKNPAHPAWVLLFISLDNRKVLRFENGLLYCTPKVPYHAPTPMDKNGQPCI
jgi:hypothetical protein